MKLGREAAGFRGFRGFRWHPWGHCVARVQRVHKVQKVQRVQRVLVAPFGRIIKEAPKAPYLASAVILYNSPLNQPALWAEPEAFRGAAPARP